MNYFLCIIMHVDIERDNRINNNITKNKRKPDEGIETNKEIGINRSQQIPDIK